MIDHGCGIEKCGEGNGAALHHQAGFRALGDGFAFMEAFMDEIQVESRPGEGNQGFYEEKDRTDCQ